MKAMDSRPGAKAQTAAIAVAIARNNAAMGAKARFHVSIFRVAVPDPRHAAVNAAYTAVRACARHCWNSSATRLARASAQQADELAAVMEQIRPHGLKPAAPLEGLGIVVGQKAQKAPDSSSVAMDSGRNRWRCAQAAPGATTPCWASGSQAGGVAAHGVPVSASCAAPNKG